MILFLPFERSLENGRKVGTGLMWPGSRKRLPVWPPEKPVCRPVLWGVDARAWTGQRWCRCQTSRGTVGARHGLACLRGLGEGCAVGRGSAPRQTQPGDGGISRGGRSPRTGKFTGCQPCLLVRTQPGKESRGWGSCPARWGCRTGSLVRYVFRCP